MKIYKCRCTKRTKTWMEIEADNPEEAAEKYAEEYYAESLDVITVMREGRFQIYTEIIYNVLKLEKK